MTNSWGRFTVRGGDELEKVITGQMERVAGRCGEVFVPFGAEAVLMLGGYGRGEGGVEVVDGVEKPHNNYDFLVVTPPLGKGRQAELDAAARSTFDGLAAELGIGIDYAVTTSRRLACSPCLVMWYDMRFGHKVILGPQDYMERYEHFQLSRVIPSDALALLVNRGSLFAINRLMLRQKPVFGENERRWFIKHMMKALIGYGDALLYFLGDYDWSYVEKGRRMEGRTDVDPVFRARYLDALDFRFKPRYGDYLDRDMGVWLNETLELCREVHLACERLRLGVPDLTWDDYAAPFYRAALGDQSGSLRAWARMVRNGLRVPSCPLAGLGFMERLGYRAAGPRGLLLVSFPAVVYPGVGIPARRGAAALLGTRDADLLTPYLSWWSRAGDTNFERGIGRMGLTLTTEGGGRDLPDGRPASHVTQNA